MQLPKMTFLGFLIITLCSSLHSAHKLNKAAQPAEKATGQKIWQRLNLEQKVKSARQKGIDLAQKGYKTYERIFYHPVYTGWFEPIYVGNKADTWGHQFLSQLNSKTPHFDDPNHFVHENFHQVIYQSWKNKLSPKELLKHQKTIHDYEKAYHRYNLNPYNENNHKELVHQTEYIYKIIHAPAISALPDLHDYSYLNLLPTEY